MKNVYCGSQCSQFRFQALLLVIPLTKYRRFIVRASSMLLLTSLVGAQSVPKVDSAFLSQQAEHLYDSVGSAVQAVGGDLNRQHLHLVFAFSTGHFAKDPLMAEAAREVASDVAANHLVNEDKLSAYAWEMQVWPHKGSSLNPLTVGADRQALRSSFQDLWPRSPQAGSNGGHDTESAITELTSQLKDDPSAVLVLLTNSAASQAGTSSQKTMGENSPAYLATLQQWSRVKTSSTTGATVQLPFDPNRPERVFDAVIVVPKQFKSAALPQDRAALLKTQAAPASKPSGMPWWTWLLGGLVLLGAAVLALRARNNRPATQDVDRPVAPARRSPGTARKLALQVGDRQIPLEGVKPGETVGILCGPGYPVGTNPGQYVVLKQTELPDQRLLVVTLERQGLKLTPEGDIAISGDLPAFLPLQEDEYRVRLSGRAARLNLPPRPFQADIPLRLITLTEN